MAMAIIMIEPGKDAFEIHRRPISPGDAINFVAHFAVNFLGPAHVVADKQVKLPIVVIIDPRAAAAPIVSSAFSSTRCARREARRVGWKRETGLLRDFRKFAVAQI